MVGWSFKMVIYFSWVGIGMYIGHGRSFLPDGVVRRQLSSARSPAMTKCFPRTCKVVKLLGLQLRLGPPQVVSRNGFSSELNHMGAEKHTTSLGRSPRHVRGEPSRFGRLRSPALKDPGNERPG